MNIDLKKNRNFILCFLLLVGWFFPKLLLAQTNPSIKNHNISLQWEKKSEGYKLTHIKVLQGKKTIVLTHPLGKYTILYAEEKPSDEPLFSEVDERARSFPDTTDKHIFNKWRNALGAVPLNIAGTAIEFFPSQSKQNSENKITFSKETTQAKIKTSWEFHPTYKNDILVEMQLTAKQKGYFSMASPTLAIIPKKELSWGMIPGYFQGKNLASDLVLSYGYGQGIPNRPVVVRERTASTLSPLISSEQGYTLAVIPEPGQARDPWEKNKNTHNDWKMGLSLMNRQGALSPGLHHPVLGEDGSYMKKGETRTFRFRYTLQASGWYEVYKHAVNDIYNFKDVLSLKDTKEALSNRVLAMYKYLKNDSTSLWSVHQYENLKIGGQDYKGPVVGSDKDAMKNSDYGAMWMLASLTKDSILNEMRLPYARNFKLTQQQEKLGFFQGAALGQYYLWKSKQFVEEWGNYVEPIALTYYVMLDIGNILLFNPKDQVLRNRLRLGADHLIKWQHADGSWEVAYNRESKNPVFSDLKDLRPTFYGLLVAYRILGDKKYLHSARKGADWFIENAVNEGNFLGVCGDFRFVPDFATGQSVQALLDLYELTKKAKYKTAAIKAARIYTTSIYTHPIPNRSLKTVKGVEREDWEISQAGLSFEHGGLLGSANWNGPILLASHAGMFVRLFALTKDPLYINMARAAAWGQDAFVDPSTHVASYYWRKMDNGPGRFPHHAWWQVGWITDYLMSEIELRSNKKISFPRGFITPKVGPHQTYNFAPGKVFGSSAKLLLRSGLFTLNNERIDFMGAINEESKEFYAILLNDSDKEQQTNIQIDNEQIIKNKAVKFMGAFLLDANGKEENKIDNLKRRSFKLPPYGLKVIKVNYEE